MFFQITISVVSSDSCKTFCSAFQLSITLCSELAYNTVQRVGQRVRNPGYSAEISAFVFLALHPFWTISLSGRRLLGRLPLHFQKRKRLYHIERFNAWAKQWIRKAYGAFFKICIETSFLIPVILAAPSNHCPRAFSIRVFIRSRTCSNQATSVSDFMLSIL